MQQPDVKFLVLGFVHLMGFHHEIFRVQIQKEAIAHLKRENQFFSTVIWESLKTDLLREFCKPGLKLDLAAWPYEFLSEFQLRTFLFIFKS
jgi:hypothetical protein